MASDFPVFLSRLLTCGSRIELRQVHARQIPIMRHVGFVFALDDDADVANATAGRQPIVVTLPARWKLAHHHPTGRENIAICDADGEEMGTIYCHEREYGDSHETWMYETRIEKKYGLPAVAPPSFGFRLSTVFADDAEVASGMARAVDVRTTAPLRSYEQRAHALARYAGS
jgi:hypothetical protein